MKKLLLAACLFIAFTTQAQQDTSTVEQYCEILATARFLSLKVSITLDYGQQRTIWTDRRAKDDEGKLIKFNSVIDALNYMGKNGWSLVNAFPVSEPGTGQVYHYVFKKTFEKGETVSLGANTAALKTKSVGDVVTVSASTQAKIKPAGTGIINNITYQEKYYSELTDAKAKKQIEKLAAKLKPIETELIKYPDADIAISKDNSISFSGFPDELTEKLRKIISAE